METADYTVRYDNVTIKRGDYTVLSGVNMKVTQGEMVFSKDDFPLPTTPVK